MTDGFIREKTRARGGPTQPERDKIRGLLGLWTRRTYRTDPIVPERIVPVINRLYAAAGLKRPHIAIAASPLALAFAYGAAAAACDVRNQKPELSLKYLEPAPVLAALEGMATVVSRGEDASRVADDPERTDKAVSDDIRQVFERAEDETKIATGSEPYERYSGEIEYGESPLYREVRQNVGIRFAWWHEQSLTQAVRTVASRRISVRRARALRMTLEGAVADRAPYDATTAGPNASPGFARRPSVGELEILIAQACHALAGQDGLKAAKRWDRVTQGVYTEFSELMCLTAFRDVLGLSLPAHKDFAHWEQAAIEGSMRVMHKNFCVVCDFPEVLKFDEQGRPHCEGGPSHRWRDGWALYHWHGTRVQQSWIEDRASLTAAFAVTIHNSELRRSAMEIVGWHNVLRELNGWVVAEDPDPQHGRLIDVRLPGLRSPARFLHVRCATGREFAVGVPRRRRTVKGAHAWLTGLPTKKFKFPTVRT